METHEDWERARVRRNQSAMMAARQLLAGDNAGALASAREAAAADDAMARIADAMDGAGDA